MVGRKNNVRRSPQNDIQVPVTYTPTTHRISKAKKGKRVHACEFPGCNKVWIDSSDILLCDASSLFCDRSSLALSTAGAMS